VEGNLAEYDDEYDDSRKEPVDEDSPIDDLSEEEQASVDALAPVQVEAIDSAILAEARPSWRKVATILGAFLLQDRGGPWIPLAFQVKRVMWLVECGKLESQGDLRRIHHSEVRLPGPGRDSSLPS
jgi:hypothetical protein